MSNKAKYMVKHIPRSPITGKKLTFAQRGALEQLADDHVEDRGSAHVKVRSIAERMGITPNNARIHLQALEREGVIESRPRVADDGRTQLPNEYRFWFDPPFDRETSRRTEQMMAYQAQLRASGPQQMSLDPLSESGGGVLPIKGGGTIETEGGGPPISGAGSPLNTTELRERETARARDTASNDADRLVEPLLIEIALAHPYAQLRRWGSMDVPLPCILAIQDAIEAETAASPPLEIGRGGTPETDRGAQLVVQAMRLLDKVQRIAAEVPRSEWRFLKSLDKFMRLREYRMEPSELYHAEPKVAAPMKPQPGLYAPQFAQPVMKERDDATALSYWRSMRDKGQAIYEKECPRDIRAMLEAEAAAGS